MAECNKKCKECNKTTTILISTNDKNGYLAQPILNFYIDTITELYDKMVNDLKSDKHNIAIILEANGQHITSKYQYCDDEIF
jgi:hypothetical protein